MSTTAEPSTTAEEISPELLLQCRSELERLRTVLRDECGRFAANRLARVELALRWIATGYYGRCGICSGRLDDDTLRETPERLVCSRCARRPERTGRGDEATAEVAW